MKKSIKEKILIFVIIILIIFSGYIVYRRISFINSKKLYYNAVKKLSKVNSYSFEQIAFVDYNDNKEEQKYLISGDIDEENKEYHLILDSYDIYGKYKNSKYYSFSFFNNEWKKYNSNDDFKSFRQLGKFLSDVKNVKEVKSDIKGLRKYKVNINKKIFNKYLYSNILNQLNNYFIKLENNDLDIYIYINKNSNIEKISCNYFDLLSDNSKKIFNKLMVDINISSINVVKNILGDNNLDDLISKYDEIESNLESYSEEDVMYDIVLSATIFCQKGTIDFSMYKNQLNNYLHLKRYDTNIIKEGIIEIDDSCLVKVVKDFKINNKTCTFDYENFESCK